MPWGRRPGPREACVHSSLTPVASQDLRLLQDCVAHLICAGDSAELTPQSCAQVEFSSTDTCPWSEAICPSEHRGSYRRERCPVHTVAWLLVEPVTGQGTQCPLEWLGLARSPEETIEQEGSKVCPSSA